MAGASTALSSPATQAFYAQKTASSIGDCVPRPCSISRLCLTRLQVPGLRLRAHTPISSACFHKAGLTSNHLKFDSLRAASSDDLASVSVLGAQQRTRSFRQISRLSLVLFNTHVQRLRSSSSFAVSAAAGSLSSSDDADSKQNPPIQHRRREQIWEELSTPVPEPPNYLLLAAGFSIVYLTRQAVAAELIQWTSLVAILGLTIVRFTQRLLVALLLKALQLVKVPIAFVMTLAGWSGLLARDVFSLIVNTTSIWPTSQALLLVTLVLSVGEATRATAVSGQPWSFLLASAFGVGAVWGVIHHTIFVLLLLLLTGFSLLVQKKDAVSAAMPATAVLVAIAEPPLKAVVLALFLAVAVYTHWKTPEDQVESPASNMRTVQPLLMVVAALFVGLTAGSRYLRVWQVLWLAK